jgi:hypothetical protein
LLAIALERGEFMKGDRPSQTQKTAIALSKLNKNSDHHS